jgi:ADP-ribose pyrophosphatase YjhB (NUDIX family)
VTEPNAHPIPRAYGVALRDDAVLMVRASARSAAPGVWWLPGGGIDWRESPEEALAREFVEETGLIVVTSELLSVMSDVRTRASGEEVHTIRIIYRVRVADGELRHEAVGTTDHAAWVPLARLDAEPVERGVLQVAGYARAAITVARAGATRSTGSAGPA